jgi:SepF-like predicted cell division protein (DUF552 family)|tara:strand:- start:1333 stop:1758 length:426 start_codon:yes stop_codon:yes gene_type:complete
MVPRRDVVAKEESGEPKWIEMPSLPSNNSNSIEAEQDYHDLGERYSQAPVPIHSNDTIIHRATLEDITGISDLMNWISEGDIVIVEMSGMTNREIELQTAVSKLQKFVENEMKGTVFGLGHNRLLLLPPNYGSKKADITHR